MTSLASPIEVAGAALAGRRERALLAEPSAAAVACMLATRCREPAPWIRAAVGTLGRFQAEVAVDGLAELLERGRADSGLAERSLAHLAFRHDGWTPGQIATLAFGPRLWWRMGGVDVSWRPFAGTGRPVPTPPIPAAAGRAARDVRLVLLALIGAGVTVDELLAVRVGDAGSIDASGEIRPDPAAEPLAFSYLTADGGRRLSFLSAEAATALRERLAERRPPADDLLVLPPEAVPAARAAASARSSALIAAGNDVNVTMCRATGDFFRAWGMPGARFDARPAVPPDRPAPRRDAG